MFDPIFVKALKPGLDKAGSALADQNVTADSITWGGFAAGLLGAAVIAFGLYELGLVFILINRLADGLDGAVARATRQTDFGGYLDIVLDFIFYTAVAGGFVLANPVHTIPGVFLMICFMATAASFLAFAVNAAKHGISTEARGPKSFFYVGGITEGSETIAYFAIVCIWTEHYVIATWIFAALCAATAAQRIWQANHAFREIKADAKEA